jgi:hypothetical protein
MPRRKRRSRPSLKSADLKNSRAVIERGSERGAEIKTETEREKGTETTTGTGTGRGREGVRAKERYMQAIKDLNNALGMCAFLLHMIHRRLDLISILV